MSVLSGPALALIPFAADTASPIRHIEVRVARPATARLSLEYDLRGDLSGLRFERGTTPGRWTFIIDREGKVVYKKMDVDPAKHAREVLTFLRKMNAEK